MLSRVSIMERVCPTGTISMLSNVALIVFIAAIVSKAVQEMVPDRFARFSLQG